MVNKYLLAASAIQFFALSLHTFTMEYWIYPGLKPEGFPPDFKFGGSYGGLGFYRTVWHFFTINLLLTFLVDLGGAFGYLVPPANTLIGFLIIFWLMILVEIFLVGALNMKGSAAHPGQSYLRDIVGAPQWVLILSFVILMFLGIQPVVP